MKNGQDEDHVALHREVDGIGEAPQKGTPHLRSNSLIFARTRSDPIVGRAEFVEKLIA